MKLLSTFFIPTLYHNITASTNTFIENTPQYSKKMLVYLHHRDCKIPLIVMGISFLVIATTMATSAIIPVFLALNGGGLLYYSYNTLYDKVKQQICSLNENLKTYNTTTTQLPEDIDKFFYIKPLSIVIAVIANIVFFSMTSLAATIFLLGSYQIYSFISLRRVLENYQMLLTKYNAVAVIMAKKDNLIASISDDMYQLVSFSEDLKERQRSMEKKDLIEMLGSKLKSLDVKKTDKPIDPGELLKELGENNSKLKESIESTIILPINTFLQSTTAVFIEHITAKISIDDALINDITSQLNQLANVSTHNLKVGKSSYLSSVLTALEK